MLIELQNPVMLSKAVEIISELVNEVRIKVNEAGLSITAMDPANVSMVGFVLPKKSFNKDARAICSLQYPILFSGYSDGMTMFLFFK